MYPEHHPALKTCSAGPSPRAFTLTELLVAISLLVIVMVGVSTVFRTTSQTIGTSTAIGSLTRSFSTAYSTLYTDIIGNNPDPFEVGTGMRALDSSRPPFLYIRSQRQAAYLDKAAENNGGPKPMFRTDSLGFFAAGNFKRQSGGGPGVSEAIATQMSDRAYIWYGHLWLPTNDDYTQNTSWYYTTPAAGTMTYPGYGAAASNPNNYFASQWTLGRICMLMVQPTDLSITYPGYTHGVLDQGTPPKMVTYYGRCTGDPARLSPFSVNSDSTNGTGAVAFPTAAPSAVPVQQARYDVIGCNATTTWEQYGGLIWDKMLFPSTGYDPTWAVAHLGYRFRGLPSLEVAPGMTKAEFASQFARGVPVFLPRCVDFIVEFAGDYLDQNLTGTLASAPAAAWAMADYVAAVPNTDGVIDFNVDATGRRTIRWYGMFRDGNDDGVEDFTISAADGYIDVAPVKSSRGYALPFEQAIPPVAPLGTWADQYVCGWSRREMSTDPADAPSTSLSPKLVRITVKLLDPNNKLPNGMTQQYIFPVRAN